MIWLTPALMSLTKEGRAAMARAYMKLPLPQPMRHSARTTIRSEGTEESTSMILMTIISKRPPMQPQAVPMTRPKAPARAVAEAAILRVMRPP